MKNLSKIFEEHGIKLSEKQLKQFDEYFSHLVSCNKQFNLTAITDEEEVAVKHFLDSVLPVEFFPKNASVIDVGSGAGFPSLPLKIVRPDLTICMVDSLTKRVNFLNEVVGFLGLLDAGAFHSRAEDFAKRNREKFDIAVARAVAPLATLVELLLPFVKVGGSAVIYKSSKLDEELKEAQKAIKTLGGEVEKIQDYEIGFAGEKISRKILIIKKVTPTPAKYPRGQNKPKLSPIK